MQSRTLHVIITPRSCILSLIPLVLMPNRILHIIIILILNQPICHFGRSLLAFVVVVIFSQSRQPQKFWVLWCGALPCRHWAPPASRSLLALFRSPATMHSHKRCRAWSYFQQTWLLLWRVGQHKLSLPITKPAGHHNIEWEKLGRWTHIPQPFGSQA